MSQENPTFNISEEIAWLNNFCGYGSYFTNPGTGNIYTPVAGGNGAAGGFYTAWYWLATQWWNQWQRYMCRFGYISNAYCSTAVNNLTILALGNGFQIQTPNKSKQKKIDAWVKSTDFRTRDIEAFRRFLIDGECFIRKFGNDKLRFVDPDLVYSSTDKTDQTLGIVTEPTDYEDVTGYIVHTRKGEIDGENVPSSEIQHRKNAHFGQRRGLSWLLPIMSDAFGADKLTNNLIRTSDVLANFAFFRKHVAPEASVRQFRDGISNQPINTVPLNQNGTPPARLPSDNIENYNSGSIIDLPANIEIEQLTGLPAESYIAVLDASLRKIAAHFHLPMGVFGNRDERGAYAAELVSNSYLVRSIEALQETWKEWDLQLLEMCGFDTSDVTIVPPEVSIIDRDQLTKEMEFLLGQKLISKQTASASFNLDQEEQLDLIRKEESEPIYQHDDNNGIDPTGDSGEQPTNSKDDAA